MTLICKSKMYMGKQHSWIKFFGKCMRSMPLKVKVKQYNSLRIELSDQWQRSLLFLSKINDFQRNILLHFYVFQSASYAVHGTPWVGHHEHFIHLFIISHKTYKICINVYKSWLIMFATKYSIQPHTISKYIYCYWFLAN